MALALAWPLAIIVAGFFLYLIVLRLTPKGVLPVVQLPNGVRIGGGGAVEPPPSPPLQEAPQIQPPGADAANVEPTPSDQKETTEDSAEEDEAIYEWLFTKDASKLKDLFDEFKSSPAFTADEEVCMTHYIRRRRELGIGGHVDEFRKLSDENNTWIKPLLWMAQDAITSVNIAAAEEYLREAELRCTQENYGSVVQSYVDLYFRLKDNSDVMAYLDKLSESEASVSNKAIGFLHYANLLKKAERKREATVLYEIGLTLDPSQNSHRFDLAYTYADIGDRIVMSFYHYNILLRNEYSKPNVANNIGVLMSSIGNKRLENHFLEEGIKEKNPLAIANLAYNLIDAGLIHRALSLIDENSELDGHEENRTAAKAKALTAARLNVDDAEKYWEDARRDHVEYQRLINDAKAFLSDNDELEPCGEFVRGEDRVTLSKNKAKIEVKMGDRTYDGTVPFCVTIYEGAVMSKGGNALTSEAKEFLLAQVSPDTVRLIITSGRKSWKSSEVRVFSRVA